MQAPRALSASSLWNTILSGITVFVATAGLLGTWVNQRVSPIEGDIIKIEKRLDDFDVRMAPLLTLYAQVKTYDDQFAKLQVDLDKKLDEKLFDSTKLTVAKQIEDDKNSTLRAMEELSHQVHELESKIVTRDEHTRESADTNSRFDGLDRRIAEIAARINALPTTKP